MELDPWLVLLQATLPPAARVVELIGPTGDPQRLLGLPQARLAAAGIGPEVLRRIAKPDAERLAALKTWLARDNRRLITFGSDAYPPLLASVPDPPLALWVHGDPAVLKEPQLAVVGSRNPTRGGLDTARGFARSLAETGLTITSGLALGIDGAGHAGALDAGAPTVAVLGCGLDIVYPRQHRSLAESVAAAGALVSEYLPDTPPERHHFPARNRLIAGLSLGTLVVEASRQSGSLITARLAGEYGREVFAIPGSIHNPMARGCHQLIRQGAKLVEQASDILKELAPQLTSYLQPAAPVVAEPKLENCLDPSYRALLEMLGFDPVTVRDLTRRSGLTTAELSSMLLVLELEGFVEALPGGRYSRIEKRDP